MILCFLHQGYVSCVQIGGDITPPNRDESPPRPTNLLIANPNQPEEPSHSDEIQNNRFSMTLACSPGNLMSASQFEDLLTNYDERPAPKAEVEDLVDISPFIDQLVPVTREVTEKTDSTSQEIDSLEAGEIEVDDTDETESDNSPNKAVVTMHVVTKTKVGGMMGEPDETDQNLGDFSDNPAYQPPDQVVPMENMEYEHADDDLETGDDVQSPEAEVTSFTKVEYGGVPAWEEDTTKIHVGGDEGNQDLQNSSESSNGQVISPPEEFGTRPGVHVQSIDVRQMETSDTDLDYMTDQNRAHAAGLITPDYEHAQLGSGEPGSHPSKPQATVIHVGSAQSPEYATTLPNSELDPFNVDASPPTNYTNNRYSYASTASTNSVKSPARSPGQGQGSNRGGDADHTDQTYKRVSKSGPLLDVVFGIKLFLHFWICVMAAKRIFRNALSWLLFVTCLYPGGGLFSAPG